MKTLSLKILGLAVVFSLLTITRAQTPDDAQTAPPVEAGGTQPAVPPPAENEQPPNVVVVPVPAEMLDTNSDSGMIDSNADMNGAPPPAGPNGQPGPVASPTQNNGRN